MKRIFTTALFLTVITNFVIAQVKLHDNQVRFVCNPLTVASAYNQTSHDFKEQGGYLFVPSSKIKGNGKSKGILIYHHVFADEYYAYDMECQQCKNDGKSGLIFMKTSITCRCRNCGSEFQNISHGSPQQTNKSGEYWLIQYNCYMKDGQLLVTDEYLDM